MCDNSEEFVQLGESLTRNRRRSGSDGGSIPGEVETGPSDSELLRILECPVCTEFPTPPIYNCAMGHFTCNDCISLLQICTICESPFTNVRNYALESIIERTRFRCKYANRGCPETAGGTGGEFKRHLHTCQYGPLLCNERMTTVCEKHPVDPEDYLEHLFSSHGASGKYVQSRDLLAGDFVQKKGEVFSPIYLKSETSHLTFILNTKKYKSFICWWITCLDLREVGHFKARLTWSKKTDTQESEEIEDLTSDCFLQWTLPIHPMKKPFNEVRDSGLCAVVPDTHLNPFLKDPESEDGEWNICVEVIKKAHTELVLVDEADDNTAGSLMDNVRRYFPLITTIFMIIALGLLFGIYIKKDSRGPELENGGVGSGQGSDDYYGYRGFYYHSDIAKPTNEFDQSKGKGETLDSLKNSRPSKDPDDYYVGYGGFYYKRDTNQNVKVDQPKSVFMKIIGKLLGLKDGSSFINGQNTTWLDIFDLLTRFSAVILTFVLIVASVYYCNFTRWTV